MQTHLPCGTGFAVRSAPARREDLERQLLTALQAIEGETDQEVATRLSRREMFERDNDA